MVSLVGTFTGGEAVLTAGSAGGTVSMTMLPVVDALSFPVESLEVRAMGFGPSARFRSKVQVVPESRGQISAPFSHTDESGSLVPPMAWEARLVGVVTGSSPGADGAPVSRKTSDVTAPLSFPAASLAVREMGFAPSARPTLKVQVVPSSRDTISSPFSHTDVSGSFPPLIACHCWFVGVVTGFRVGAAGAAVSSTNGP